MSEWIARVMPLPARDRHLDADARRADLARFRIRIVAPHDRPGLRPHGPRQSIVDVGLVRILALDTVNPHGGVGGSLDSDQCAWLVRELDRARDRYVVVASHDGSRTLTSDAVPPGAPSRVLGAEVASILLANGGVIAWIAGSAHERAGRRHGDGFHGFWEIPGASSGYGAPLAGGIAVTVENRHRQRTVTMQGALAGDAGPHWDLPDPLPTVSAAVLPVPAVAPR